MEKIIALVISTFYLIVVYTVGGTGICFTLFALLLIPISCIWLGSKLANYKGFTSGGGYITKELLKWSVRAIGWILLLLPGVMVLISIVTVKR